MKTIYWILIILVLSSAFLWYYFDSQKQTETLTITNNITPTPTTSTITKENCLADDCLEIQDIQYPVSDLSTDIHTALDKAIDDEYKAKTTYEAVVDKFGSVKPFIQIIGAEDQHIASLKAIYEKYGIAIPVNPYLGNISAPETIQASCALGVQAEIANAALYRDELIPAVKGYEDIVTVFTNLMNASQDKHLPAFEKCQ